MAGGYNTSICREQGGSVLAVNAGGEIRVRHGGKITADGARPALPDLAGAAGGAADGVLEDVSTPVEAANEGAEAAAAASVDARLEAIANNFAELVAELAGLKAALRAVGIVEEP